MYNLEALDYQELAELRDAINRQMFKKRRTTGLRLNELLDLFEEVKTTLRDQGKEWRSLERWQWMDGQIRFWLNPTDQVQYQSGWFTIDELIQWSQNNGPVLISEEPEDDEDEPWTEVDGVRIRWLADGTMQREG